MRLLWAIFFLVGPLEKGVWRFEIVLGFFIFLGGNPWKRESGDLRLLWDYFFNFFGGNPWKRESGDLRLLWDYFLYFFGGDPWKREYIFLVAPLGKGSLEI